MSAGKSDPAEKTAEKKKKMRRQEDVMSVGTGSSYIMAVRGRGSKRSPNTQIAEGRPEWKVVGKVALVEGELGGSQGSPWTNRGLTEQVHYRPLPSPSAA